ncbi:hypothetical protein N7539_000978 [Penicillium diatomitis]|uniref:Rad4-domain-containing protein n=1 Tax=Penicillium diatomitis TaxID=2819901 RepID=A0A9X0C2Q8_9EURO|nr:uncharacterized protein N7539_000978 [Penicillium diatomitis]KAJ5495862.1 hypothetical protein N7539_000978 [Penicillium diatomitis]
MPSDELAEVYQEMLAEAEARDPEQFHSDRPIKRRKVGGSNGVPTKAIPIEFSKSAEPATSSALDYGSPLRHPHFQVIYDSTSSEESDIEWEDVDVEQPAPTAHAKTNVNEDRDETLQITLDEQPETSKKRAMRRKPLSKAEKQLRLDTHKAHLLCLLAHVQIRNKWCNDNALQSHLKTMLPRNIINLLHPDETKHKVTRSTTFMDGLHQAGDRFARRFRVTKTGLKRAYWAEDPIQLKEDMDRIMSEGDTFLSKDEFLARAHILQGSRDFGAQLFCALLRAAAVEARLVCSLQTLPFSGTTQDPAPARKSQNYIVLSSDDQGSPKDESQRQLSPPKTPSQQQRIGRPTFQSRPAATTFREKLEITAKPTESPYPVFWVEAYNEAIGKWLPIDPIVTKTLAKPSKLEPPASDIYNSMSYVVAFEDDASARDVTRRYAKAFNAKTRKARVESTPNGGKWLNMALAAYEKPFLEDRDDNEFAELTTKSAAEGMPRNLMDFKDHPVYALERHLRRNEVIFPKHVVGHVGLSKAGSKNDNLETVYRRSDVHVVRSADRWYRLGRDVKVGEQPLKHVTANKAKSGFASDEEDQENEQTPLYAEYQTEVYQPPPVVQGQLPKNAYGNLDVYVPSMVPPGAVHVRHPDAARAANLLGIDYADAVTGFEFRGRRGTAVVSGIVVVKENLEALQETISAIADDRRQAAMEARSEESLRLWRLFLTKLRIADRVKVYASEDETMDSGTGRDSSPGSETEYTSHEGGGFLPEESGGFLPEESGGFLSEESGGFLPEEGEGFLAEDTGPSIDRFAGDDDGAADGVSGQSPDHENLTTRVNVSDSSVTDPQVPRINQMPPTQERGTKTQTGKKAKKNKPPRYELIVVPSKNGGNTSNPDNTNKHDRDVKSSSAIAPMAMESSTQGDPRPVSLATISPSASPTIGCQPAAVVDSDSEIEKGSLMSEDPEDEDAIPEWLL